MPSTTHPASPGFSGSTGTSGASTVVDTQHGAISIAPRVVYSLVTHAATETYGVVGIASRFTGFDNTRVDPRRGIEITFSQAADLKTHCTVHVHVIVEYGVRIRSVTSSLQHQITYAIQRSTGYQVDAVYVNVTGLRVTDIDSA
jgi:uncharacterized alkaline shock family protein YloU